MKSEIIPAAFSILLLLITLQSTAYYFGKLKLGFTQWLFFNPCAISNICFLIGFGLSLSKGDRTILHSPILPMFFFGTMGIFFLPWYGMNIIPQAGHIIMTANIALTIWTTLTSKDYRAAAIGLIIGVVIFTPFIALQQKYVRDHPQEFRRMLGGTELDN